MTKTVVAFLRINDFNGKLPVYLLEFRTGKSNNPIKISTE